ncbi:hypothetical protein FQA47_003728 [Oryzias melastigma]|uniref:Uncharacterized protein n=1 Tax=Oryzias melastigma TaxID=30732 RepID=A0A834C363_ORYME|nr:hypothetical protein FQA47_003728 [Oryzias melastigma]
MEKTSKARVRRLAPMAAALPALGHVPPEPILQGSPSTRDVTDGFPPQSSPSERRDTQLEEREEVLPSPPMLPDSPGGTCVDLLDIFPPQENRGARL